MTVSINSYGLASDVAAMTPRYLSSGAFTTSTIPSMTQVEAWIDQVSASLNVALSASGFVIPVTQADAKLACAGIVVNAVADLAHFANSAGRFYSDKALEGGISPWKSIYDEMNAWAASMTPGFILLGAVYVGKKQTADVVQVLHNPTGGGRDLADAYTADTNEIGVLHTW